VTKIKADHVDGDVIMMYVLCNGPFCNEKYWWLARYIFISCKFG